MSPDAATAAYVGLSEQEAQQRLVRDGLNELPSARRQGLLALAWTVVREPMIALLISAGVIYLILGDLQQAAALMVSVVAVVGLTLYQERKTEHALEALRDLSSPRALVVRDGVQRRIPGREVVQDDLLLLREGDRVPADALLLKSTYLSVDESLLTGESVPVRKLAAPDGSAAPAQPGGDDKPFLFSGTLVVQGQGAARVGATGRRTRLGSIGKALAELSSEPPRLQTETRAVVRLLAVVGLALCAFLAATYALTRGDWLNGILAGLTLAISILPEEFPVVLTVFLALGAWRISRKQVLTRRTAAIEALGAATVLCVDKTGTLTENRMSLDALYGSAGFFELQGIATLPEDFHALLEFATLAGSRDPFDPMEKAVRARSEALLAGTEHLHRDWELVEEYPISGALLAMSRVWRSPDAARYVIAAKGAPEAIAGLCHLDEAESRGLAEKVNALAGRGMRVLGVARAYADASALPSDQHGFRFQFVGLLGFVDPVRPDVAASIAECYRAGMRVIMITGDYSLTARSVAQAIGLKGADAVIQGPELDAMDEETLRRRIREVSVFCRTVPEQKLRLVNALKANGEIVAMTGDGVNDAPALKAAHIGIAMGSRGTDVAREAASLVLLDDHFSSIVAAARLGRRIYDNIRKATAYIIAVHPPIIGMSLAPVVFGWPLVLLPVHIVFLELIIDPACSVVFEAEPEEPDVMDRPPRPPETRLFDADTVAYGVLQGVSLWLAVLVIYAYAGRHGLTADQARALAFTVLVIGNLGFIFSNRSRSRSVLETLRIPNRALRWVVSGAMLVLALTLFTPLREFFRFAPFGALEFGISLLAALTTVFTFDLWKRFLVRRRRAA